MTARLWLALAAPWLAAGCSGAYGSAEQPRTGEAPAVDGRLFTRLPASYTGVRFANRVTDSREQNVFTYRNHYNGGGVALGDLSGDGLPEMVLTANEGGARLYLNEGTFRFRVTDIFSSKELDGAVVQEARTFATALARNNGDGTFTLVPLPAEAQRAPVYGVLAQDVDGDGRLDLLLAGNFDGVKPELGRMSASYGLLLRGDPSRSARDKLAAPFTPLPVAESGFFVPGQARDVERVRTRDGALYVVSRNNDRPLVFRRSRSDDGAVYAMRRRAEDGGPLALRSTPTQPSPR